MRTVQLISTIVDLCTAQCGLLSNYFDHLLLLVGIACMQRLRSDLLLKMLQHVVCVCLFVCFCDGHTGELCKNGWIV